MSKNEKTFKNTFSRVENKELTVPQIICGLYAGVIKFSKLPDEAKKAVLGRVKPDPPNLWNTPEDDARGLIRTSKGTRKATPEELATFPSEYTAGSRSEAPPTRTYRAKPEKDQCDSRDAV